MTGLLCGPEWGRGGGGGKVGAEAGFSFLRKLFQFQAIWARF